MAGMLPGVEAARRRRVHQSSGCSSMANSSSPSSRRSSFSLFSPKSSASFLSQPRSRTYQDDEKLGQLAREAKGRLDEKLRAQTKSIIGRNNSDLSEERVNGRLGGNNIRDQLRTEVFGSKKNRGKKRLIGWAKLGWKSGEQEECAVCLDEYKVGDNLVNLPCAHRFHSKCLVPWLHTNTHCPCCRMSILSKL